MSKKSKKRTHKKALKRKRRAMMTRRCSRTRSRPLLQHYSVPPFSGSPVSGSTARSDVVFEEPIVIPRGDGSFLVAPGKLRTGVLEVGTLRAAKMLGIGHTALRAARESKLGRHFLRWRFTTEKQRVLAWEVPSLMAYKEATRSVGK